MTGVVAFLAANWRAIAVAGIVAAVFFVGARYGAAGPLRDLAEQKTRQAEQIAEWNRQKAAAAAESLRRQQDLQEAADAARMSLDTSRRTIAAQASRIAVLAADSKRLRGKLATFAAGQPGSDSLAACQSRAGALASLLAEGAGLVVEGANLARECSIDHDRRAAEVNSLLSAWPASRVAVH